MLSFLVNLLNSMQKIKAEYLTSQLGKGGKGLGKGGAKRHRKVLRDNIQRSRTALRLGLLTIMVMAAFFNRVFVFGMFFMAVLYAAASREVEGSPKIEVAELQGDQGDRIPQLGLAKGSHPLKKSVSVWFFSIWP